jgi:hypothetical protein
MCPRVGLYYTPFMDIRFATQIAGFIITFLGMLIDSWKTCVFGLILLHF